MLPKTLRYEAFDGLEVFGGECHVPSWGDGLGCAVMGCYQVTDMVTTRQAFSEKFLRAKKNPAGAGWASEWGRSSFL